MANYPEAMVAPMREELVQAGFTQLMTPTEVDQAISQRGTTLLVINSVCGCAAGTLRPGVIAALKEKGLRFDHLVTVFAGMETEATRRAREYFEGAAPTSPNVAIFQNGNLVHHMPRGVFEDRSVDEIAEELEQVVQAKLN